MNNTFDYKSLLDIIISIILILVIFFISKKSKENLGKGWYSKGVLAKLVGAFFFCSVYAFYYGGGDTINYYQGVDAMYSLFWYSPLDYIEVLFSGKGYGWDKFHLIGKYPPVYMFRDTRTFTVIKLTSVVSLFGFGGFFSTTILLARLTYIWIWKMYCFLKDRYTGSQKWIALVLLFYPSCLCWGSGIMKDTFTYSAGLYFLVGLNDVFIKKERILSNLFQLSFAFYILITIKSYLLFALMPGALVFLNFERIKGINSRLVKFIVIPVFIGVGYLLLQYLFLDMDELFGRYTADRLLEEAVIQQQDLKRSVYGTNSFDIGNFDASLGSVISKAHLAVNAALFRPYIWESTSNPVMFISGIENLSLLLISLNIILFKGLNLFKILKSDGLVIFCLIFIILLGFGVGLSTSNFGALVRYKIPLLPFFGIVLILLSGKVKLNKS